MKCDKILVNVWSHMQDVSSKSIYYSVIIIPCKNRRHIRGVHHALVWNVFKMTDFWIFIEFHKISKIFDFVPIISIWKYILLLNLVSILYLFKISIFYMKIQLSYRHPLRGFVTLGILSHWSSYFFVVLKLSHCYIPFKRYFVCINLYNLISGINLREPKWLCVVQCAT